MIIPSFLPLVGGAELQLFKLTSALVDNGQEVEILTRKHENNLLEEEIIDNCRVKRLTYFFYPFGFLISLFIWLFKNRKDFKVIHVHTVNSPAFLASFFSWIFNKSVIIKVTSSGENSVFYQFNLLKIWLLKLFKANFLSLTKSSKDELVFKKIPKNRIFVVPNGVHVSSFLKKSNQKLKFLFVGRIVKQKNIDLLIKAWSLLDRNLSELFIVGDGTEVKRIQELIKEKSLENEVFMLGNIKNSEVQKLMQKSDSIILPSDSEGFSNAVLEAMSNSMVPIVKDIKPNLEIFEDKNNGLIFHDKYDLYNCMLSVIHDQSLRDSIALEAFNSVRRNYSINKVAKEYIRIYKFLSDYKNL